jgi:hypothetical protein
MGAINVFGFSLAYMNDKIICILIYQYISMYSHKCVIKARVFNDSAFLVNFVNILI